MRSIRSDPIILVLVAFPSPLRSTLPLAPRPKQPTFRLESSMKTILTYHAALRMASRHPLFKPAVQIQSDEIDPGMNSQRFLFVIEIPPKFQKDVLAGRQLPFKSMSMPPRCPGYNGMTYIQNVIINYVTQFISKRDGWSVSRSKCDARKSFNPNLKSAWFTQ